MKCISRYAKNQLNAGPKAKVDVEQILKEKFNSKIYTFKLSGKENEMNSIQEFIHKIRKAIFSICHVNGDELTVIQFPYINETKITDKAKNKIALIHDLEGLRSQNEKIEKKELNALSTYKYIISHNERMKQYLIQNGIDEKKILVLELFDYICQYTRKDKVFSKDIVYTGNLDKAAFIDQMDEDKMNFKMNLYGILNKNLSNKNMIYKGKFLPDELPQNIDGDLGLVWDGNIDESDENEGFKRYTKYNNPHKLSCYIATEIPVIVWEKSAIADFVKENNIGYTINNIYDINEIDFSDYSIKKENVKILGEKVRNGYYTQKVMNVLMNKIDKEL